MLKVYRYMAPAICDEECAFMRRMLKDKHSRFAHMHTHYRANAHLENSAKVCVNSQKQDLQQRSYQ